MEIYREGSKAAGRTRKNEWNGPIWHGCTVSRSAHRSGGSLSRLWRESKILRCVKHPESARGAQGGGNTYWRCRHRRSLLGCHPGAEGIAGYLELGTRDSVEFQGATSKVSQAGPIGRYACAEK